MSNTEHQHNPQEEKKPWYSMEEMQKENAKWRRERDEFNRRWDEEWEKELRARGIKPFDPNDYPPQRHDHPNTMEDGTATFLWIVVMVVGSIFKGNWAIWIIATVIWYKFITRYKKK